MLDEVHEVQDIEVEEQYIETINKYQRKLKRKAIIVLATGFIVSISSFFSKYEDFFIVLNSPLFILLFIFTIFMAVTLLLYLNFSKNKIDKKQMSKSYKTLLDIFELLSIVPVFMLTIIMINLIGFSPASVKEKSMQPNYYDGDDVIFSHFDETYERFDVVIIQTQEGEGYFIETGKELLSFFFGIDYDIQKASYYIKRIIGMPGDNIIIDHNVITINGVVIEQEFLEDENGLINVYTRCNEYELVCEFNVPDNSYFVMGDNREVSLDSRSPLLGYVSEDQIYGKVIYKFGSLIKDFFN